MHQQTVTTEDILQWKTNPVTQLVKQDIIKHMNDLMEMWANGAYTDSHPGGSMQQNARAIGQCQAFQSVLDYMNEVTNNG